MSFFENSIFKSRLLRMMLLLSLYIIVFTIVYLGGGTKYAYPHLIYIPILFSALFYELGGGMIGGILGGIGLGIMPLETNPVQIQSLANISIRFIFLTGFGVAAGMVFKILNNQYEQLEKIAYYDYPTGLPNKLMFKKRLDTLLANKQNFVVVTLVVENIIEVLSIVGHSQHDRVLKEIATFFKKKIKGLNIDLYKSYTFRKEFILHNYTYESAKEWLESINKIVQDVPILVDNYPVFLKLSAGAYIITKTDYDSDEVIRKLYIAHENAKNKFKDYLVYHETMEDKLSTTHIITEIMNSLKNNELYIEYQPKLNLSDNKIYSLEALIRWKHPIMGNIPPVNFIPQLEKTNYINSLSYWILTQVIADLKDWKTKGIHLRVAINITPRNLQNKEFVEKILYLLSQSNINTLSLELEVTESDLMNELESIGKTLFLFKEKGVKISMDDFGTGYSSLSYLKKLPIDCIKIDRSFIKDICTDNHSKEIVDTAIRLGHTLDKIIVAEGVEDLETLNLLKEMNCDEIQGYYFARPMTKDKLEIFLNSHNYIEEDF